MGLHTTPEAATCFLPLPYPQPICRHSSLCLACSCLLGHLRHLILILQDPVGDASSGKPSRNYLNFLQCFQDVVLLMLLQFLPNALLLAASAPASSPRPFGPWVSGRQEGLMICVTWAGYYSLSLSLLTCELGLTVSNTDDIVEGRHSGHNDHRWICHSGPG